eukprot:tig00020554_g10923.t1
MPTCGKLFVKPKYKKFIDLLFPKDPEGGIVARNGKKFTEFSAANTHKLPKIGKYIQARVQRDLGSRKYGFVKIAMKVLNLLIQACHTDTEMTLYASNVMKCVEALIKQQREDLRLAAIETFIQFVHYQDESTNHRKLDGLMDDLMSLCLDETQVVDSQRRLRMAGLLAIIKMIHKMSGHITEQYPRIIPIVLVNMQYPKERDVPGAPEVNSSHVPFNDAEPTFESALYGKQEESVRRLAYRCLVDAFSRTNSATARALLDPLFSFLDKYDGWMPIGISFGNECMKVVTSAVPAQHSYVIFVHLLRYLDSEPDRAIHLKAGIVYVATSVLALTRGALGPAAMGRSSLLRHLLARSQDQNSLPLLHNAIIQCFGMFGSKLQSWTECTDMLAAILAKMPPGLKSMERESVGDRRLLFRCAIHLVSHYQDTTNMKGGGSPDQNMAHPVVSAIGGEQNFPTPILETILFAAQLQDGDTRLLALRLLLLLLGPFRKTTDNDISFSCPSSGFRPLMILSKQQRYWVHSALFQAALQTAGSSPQHFVAISSIFSALLHYLRIKELHLLVPLIFALEERALQSPSGVAQCVNSLISSQLAGIGMFLNSGSLIEYSETSISRARDAGLLSPFLNNSSSGLVASGPRPTFPASITFDLRKPTGPHWALLECDNTDISSAGGHGHINRGLDIDRGIVVSCICKIPAVIQERSDARELLMQPFNEEEHRLPPPGEGLTLASTMRLGGGDEPIGADDVNLHFITRSDSTYSVKDARNRASWPIARDKSTHNLAQLNNSASGTAPAMKDASALRRHQSINQAATKPFGRLAADCAAKGDAVHKDFESVMEFVAGTLSSTNASMDPSRDLVVPSPALSATPTETTSSQTFTAILGRMAGMMNTTLFSKPLPPPRGVHVSSSGDRQRLAANGQTKQGVIPYSNPALESSSTISMRFPAIASLDAYSLGVS